MSPCCFPSTAVPSAPGGPLPLSSAPYVPTPLAPLALTAMTACSKNISASSGMDPTLYGTCGEGPAHRTLYS